jgi:uncharacterized protein
MSAKRSIHLRCPICKKPVKNSDPHFPFCSERCRLFDLGKWASGDYVIPSPITDEEEIPNLPEDTNERE